MKRTWISIFVAATFLIFVQPLKTDAKTSVYFSIGLGGAAIVGGAYLFWHLSVGSRVSGRIPEAFPSALLAFTPDTLREQRFQTPSDHLSIGHPDESPAVAITWPVFTYRW